MTRARPLSRNFERDNAILGLRADGLAVKSIARSLGLPAITVAGVVARARAKGDVRTNPRDLVALRERALDGWAAGEAVASIAKGTGLSEVAIRSTIRRARRGGDARATLRRTDPRADR